MSLKKFEEQIWAHVERKGIAEHWPAMTTQIKLDGKQIRTPRAVYLLTHRSANGRVRCPDDPACCNPAHLAMIKLPGGTAQFGESNPAHKLEVRDVVAIRERVARGETRTGLAREYGVAFSTVSKIVSRKTWK